MDRVLEVQDISEEDIEETPEMDAGAEAKNILGISKAGGRVTILLDIERVLGGDLLDSLQETDDFLARA